MDNAKYYYNSKTCQYERARINPGGIIVYVLGLVVTSALFLAGLIVLNDYLIVTDNEQALRQENKMLSEHKKVLNQQLASIEQTLSTLKRKTRIFYTPSFQRSPGTTFGYGCYHIQGTNSSGRCQQLQRVARCCKELVIQTARKIQPKQCGVQRRHSHRKNRSRFYSLDPLLLR